jgi:hypothetical protein
MSIVNSSYFIAPYEITDIEGFNPAASANSSRLTAAINIYEPEFLTALLGKTLYDELTAGLAVLPVPDAKWTALRDKLANSTTKKSCIAAYVWNRYWTDEETKSTSMGQIVPKMENSYRVSSNQKLVMSWNDAMTGAETFYDWMTENLTDYPTLDTNFDFFYRTNILGV